jgi:hypothetical protein
MNEGLNLIFPHKLKRGDWLIEADGWRKIKHLLWARVGMNRTCMCEMEFHGTSKERMIKCYRSWETVPIVRLKAGDYGVHAFKRMLGAFIELTSEAKWPPLHCMLGSLWATRYWLMNDVQCDINTHCGLLQLTPIHLACMDTTLSNRPLVHLLLAHGADPLRVNANGETALDIALNRDNWTCAELLVARGFQAKKASLMQERWRARWALVYCIRKRHRFPSEIVRDIMNWI